MHPLIETHREQIEVLCRRYGVKRLDVFGSALRDDFDAGRSDVDIAVDFEQAAPGEQLDQYFGFKQQLEHVLGRPVDLIELEAMENTRLKRIIERSKVPVYAASACSTVSRMETSLSRSVTCLPTATPHWIMRGCTKPRRRKPPSFWEYSNIS